MLIEFVTVVLYTQVLLANPAGHDAAATWTDDEVAQGFAWSPEVVAFGVPDHDGDCLVSVDIDAQGMVRVADDALWAVAVPFTARGDTVDVGTVLMERALTISPGRYQVVFQARPGGSAHAFRLEISFSRSDVPGYAILRQGSLGSDRVLQQRVHLR